MEAFVHSLGENRQVTGLHISPSFNDGRLKHKPLIIGLHGATYRASYFDGNDNFSASRCSVAFDVPFVAIDRPGYGGTTPVTPIPSGSSFDEETGSFLHNHAIPFIWNEYGVPNGCVGVVILGHSMGIMGAVTAAAMHAQDLTPGYPLLGIIVSGLGSRQLPIQHNVAAAGTSSDRKPLEFSAAVKDTLMFSPGSVDSGVLSLTQKLNCPAPFEETACLPSWVSVWRTRWAPCVKVPVLYALSEQDCFFEGTTDHLDECAAAFVNSPRIDTAFIQRAPHCLELSYYSQGWYAYCFGFSMQCAASFAIGVQG